MKLFSEFDIKWHFKQNGRIYFTFFLFFIFGLGLGLIIVLGGADCTLFIKSEDNILPCYINGEIVFLSHVWRMLLKFVSPMILMFLICLNGILSYLVFGVVAYQSCLLFLNVFAIISEFGISGVLDTLLFIIPVNVVLFVVITIFGTICFNRARQSSKIKNFSTGFDGTFFVSLFACFMFAVLFSFVLNIVLVLTLRNSVFVIF